MYCWQLEGATNYYKRGGIMVVGNDKLYVFLYSTVMPRKLRT